MSTRTPSKVKTPSAPTPSYMPVRTGFLHRKRAFGPTPSLTDECAASHGKSLVLQPFLIQAKLIVNEPGDKYEQEANRVADQVMRMGEHGIQMELSSPFTGDPPFDVEEESIRVEPLSDRITPLIQRQVEPEEEEEEEKLIRAKPAEAQIQRQEEEPEEEEEEPLQAKEAGGQAPRTGTGLKAQIQALRGRGQPLPRSVRNFFEPRFGYDFSRVRIHSDTHAAETARLANAQALTVGRDVMFGAGRYEPGTAKGQRLLAHELTHVLQQTKIKYAPEEQVQRQFVTPYAAGGGYGGLLHRGRRIRPIDPCRFPYYKGMNGVRIARKTWYPHDYKGALAKNHVRSKSSSTGYGVPKSQTSNYNCMRWAVGHGEPKSREWWQGVTRSSAHPWPEEEFLISKGCTRISASKSAKHKAKLYEYKNQDQFHIVRQENDGLWSAKTGASFLWRGIQNPDSHTTSFYSQSMSNLRVSYWSCP